MATASRFANLASLTGTAQLDALKQAANFELALPNLFIDTLGSAAGCAFATTAGTKGAGVQLFSAKAAPAITVDAIKSALALKWATPSDNPILASTAGRVATVFNQDMPALDLGWLNLFTHVDLRTSNHASFDIIDTSAGIVYEQLKPGGKIKPRRNISESKTTVPVLTYSAGIGLLDDWFRFQQWWNVEEVIESARVKAWDKQAELHYGLLTALGSSIDVAFTTDDTTTYNAAAASIKRALAASGGVGNAPLWIVCAPEHAGRIGRMLEATAGSAIVAAQASKEPLAHAVAGVISTTHVPSNSDGYYLVMPGRKLKRGTWSDLQIETSRDGHSRANDWLYSMQFNAAVGDSAQVRRVKFA